MNPDNSQNKYHVLPLNSQTQFYYGSIVKSGIIVEAKATTWATISLEDGKPNSYPLFPYGYYLLGGSHINIYSISFNSETHREVTMALYNPDNFSVTLNVQVNYVYVSL